MTDNNVRYVHVGQDGKEESFPKKPHDRPTLCVEAFNIALEQTYTFVRNEKIIPPKGKGWTFDAIVEHGMCARWLRRRK